jgi:tetratricopeptide (TPR) repeat protein
VRSNENLRLLLDARLIRASDEEPEGEFVFEHALIQEAAYASLLRTERRSLHCLVGESLEAEHPGLEEELSPRLAEHFLQGGDSTRALLYLRQAGHAAARVNASAESSIHFARAFDLIEAESSATDDLEDVVGGLGRALELQSRFQDALRAYEWLEDAARRRAEPGLQLTALMARAKILATPNPAQDPVLAASTLDEALALAQQSGDVAAESRVLWNQMILRIYSAGDIREAVRLGQTSLALARREGLEEQSAFTLNDLVYAYTALDDPTSALAAQAEAESLWRRLGNLPMLADCLAISVPERHMLGEFAQARAAAEEAAAIALRIDNLWGQANSRFFIGAVYLDQGRPDLALESRQETIRLGRLSGHDVAAYVAEADLAWIHAYLGDPQRARRELEAVAASPPPYARRLLTPHVLGHLGRVQIRLGDLEGARRTFAEAQALLQPEGLRLMAPFLLPMGQTELALARGDLDGAQIEVHRYLAFIQDHKARAFLPEALALWAEVERRIGREPDALRDLLRAYEEARVMGHHRMLGPLGLDLSRLDRERGPEWKNRSRVSFDFVASHIPDEGQRLRFLQASAAD